MEQLTQMPLSKKLFLLGIFIALTGAIFYFSFYLPLQDELSSLKNKQTKLEKKLKKAQKQKKTFDEDRKQRDAMEIASVKQRQILPAETEMFSFLNNLNAKAELAGLEILSVIPQNESPSDYFARIPVKLKLEGSFHQLTKFFYQIGKLDRIINIEDINIAKPIVSDSVVLLTAEVLATTFRSLDKNNNDVVKETKKGKKRKKKK